MVTAICPSDVLDEPSRQQVARPLSSNSNRLWQPRLHQAEAEVEAYDSIGRVLPQLCRRGFGANFEGWSLDLVQYLACASRRFQETCQGFANSSPGHCAADCCCFATRGVAVPLLGPCQTMLEQMAAGQLGVRGNGCVLLGSRAQAEWAPRRVWCAPALGTAEAALPLRPSDLVFGSV